MKTILILVNLETTIYNFRREVVRAMVDAGYRVVLCMPKGERWQYFQDMGYELVEMPVDRHGMNPMKDLGLFFRYIKLLRHIKPNLVMTYTIKPNVFGGLACSFTRTPYFSTITGLGNAVESKGLLSKLTIFLYWLGLRCANTVFFQNDTNRQFFEKKGIIRDNFILTAGSGVNLNVHDFAEYPLDDGQLTILWIGRILKDKGIEEFLSCVELLKEKYPNVAYEMLGRDDNQIYAEQLQTMETQGLLTYHGQQPSVDEYIKRSHAIVVPSYHEGLCNALLEAEACGRPVLTTNVAGCLETFDEGISGFGCASKSTDGLLKIMERFILLSYEEKRQMGIAGREKVEKEFDRKIVVQAYLEEIQKLIGV